RAGATRRSYPSAAARRARRRQRNRAETGALSASSIRSAAAFGCACQRQYLARALLIGDEDGRGNQPHGAEQRLRLVRSAGSENADGRAPQPIDLHGHHPVVDRMVDELAVPIEEVEKHVAHRTLPNQVFAVLILEEAAAVEGGGRSDVADGNKNSIQRICQAKDFVQATAL